MKKKIMSVLGLAATLALPACAQTVPSYATLTASGSTTAMVAFATSPLQQVRIVNGFATSDLAGSKLYFRTGVTPMTVLNTNSAGTTITVVVTNGITAGSWVLIETKAGVITNAAVVSFSGSTNIVLSQSVCATLPGDQVYSLSAPVSLAVGAAAATYTGDALYVGNRGRPVLVYVNGTSACTLDTITGRYE